MLRITLAIEKESVMFSATTTCTGCSNNNGNASHWTHFQMGPKKFFATRLQPNQFCLVLKSLLFNYYYHSLSRALVKLVMYRGLKIIVTSSMQPLTGFIFEFVFCI